MTVPNDSLDAARRRIQAAYDPNLIQSAGHSLVDLLAEHLRTVENSGAAVLNWADPREYVAEAAGELRAVGHDAILAGNWDEDPDNEEILARARLLRRDWTNSTKRIY